MAKFLWHGSYTIEGTKGLLKEGGTSRREVVDKLAASLGGRIEAFYYALGESDVYVIAELPDEVDATAVSLTVNAAGGISLKTVRLLSPEDVDEAAKKSVEYRPPGG